MKKIAFFCIPAHGHTNPMLPVASELVKRGNTVRFYSFDEFANKIKATGADFVSCNAFLSELTEKEEAGLKNVSTTEMTIQDIRITLSMDAFLDEEFKTFQPSTFAFNQMASQYMKNSPKELADMVFGLPKISKELKMLKPYGYKVRNALSLVQSDNKTDSVVYTSERFQPYSESFSDHYVFVGPSVFSKTEPFEKKERPLVYISMSMGTVINDRPDFYAKCIDALKDEKVDVIISCGNALDISALRELPENIKVYPYVDQLDVLSRADAFITHCGMNSVSESLYMATPMILYPQTSEQKAVARRAKEIGAGVMLTNDSVQGIRSAVLEILNNNTYAAGAKECSKDFRSCSGPAGAAAFIENAPHESAGVDILEELNKSSVKIQILYWLVSAALIVLFGLLTNWKYVWIIGIAAGVLSTPITKAIQKKKYNSLVEKSGNKK